MRPSRARVATVAIAAAALTAAGAGALANATSATPPPAPVLGDAGQGGAVILWLKNEGSYVKPVFARSRSM